MDIYTNPPPSTYVTSITKFFMMPTDSGGIPAVAVTKKNSVYITNTYTILIILLFMNAWNLILALIMALWPTRGDPNRQTALVALWNSGESMNATMLMASYCMRTMSFMIWGKPEKLKKHDLDTAAKGYQSDQAAASQGPGAESKEITAMAGSGSHDLEKQGLLGWTQADRSSDSGGKYGVSNLLWGLLFAFIAFGISVGNIFAGIFVPVQLSMGNVVSPATDVIFYPDIAHYTKQNDGGAALAKLDSLKAPSALRSLGSIEATDVTVRERVYLYKTLPPKGVEPNLWAGLDYNYNVTGVDMGLQSDPKLTLKVKGSCFTDYTWLANSTDQEDTYTLFGGSDTHVVKRDNGLGVPPIVSFFLPKDPDAQSSNSSYAMIIETNGRYSYTSGQDPWYATNVSDPGSPIAYQVAPKRPVLSCWEDRKWSLNGKEVQALQLNTLPGLKLHKLWAGNVFPLEFALPRVVSLGKAAGTSALRSSSYAVAPNYVLDAGASTILDDLERLVLGSWVSSRNVLTDTTTYNRGNIPNVLEGGKGSVEDSVAQFVLQSGDVITLSVRILISIPSVLLFLYIVQKILFCVLRRSHLGQKPIFEEEKRGPRKKKNVSNEEKNAIALMATQLFRALSKKLHPSWDWQHEDSDIPFVYPYDESERTGLTSELEPDTKPAPKVEERSASADGI